MKPHRLKLAHHLLLSYNLYREMDVYRPHLATGPELTRFHQPDYINFLEKVQPGPSRAGSTQQQKFSVGEFTDCPVFEGLYRFCQSYTGASIDGAIKLNHNLADICVNWSGGLHHAKKAEASGFCYVNDIVLAILELLKYHPRVLYIDIDIHHGDGVEEAFYTTDRVMTLSFHKYGDFFPGTGDIEDVGSKTGKYYSVNFPLQEGIDDNSFESIFKPVVDKVMEVYRPSAVVLQCGADSLTGDRLGCFNLTLKGHAEAVKHVKSFGVPMLVLGGGGYTIRNVARCWAYETGVLLGKEIDEEIPYNDYFEYYSPDFKLHLTPSPHMENLNTPVELDRLKTIVLRHLQALQGAPSVQMTEIPPDFVTREKQEEDADPDQRPARVNTEGGHKKRHAAELYDAKGPGVMGGGGTGASLMGGKGGGGGGRGSPSPTSSGGIREGGAGASGAADLK